jgi:L-ascorbate metabolism protein UlaG (beta-lactamase superfamily)
MKIRYLGHSSFQISTHDKVLVVDPFIAGNPLAAQIRLESLEADYLLITHAHGDHTGDAVVLAKRTGAKIISNFEIVSWFHDKGIPGHGMNHGGKKDFDFGTLKYVHAVHSSTFPDNTPGGNPGGFVLWNTDAALYIAGDTALSTDMQLIPMTCPKLTAAILPIGDNYTMGYEDAIHAARFLQCDLIIGCHFDTFDAIRIDHEAAIRGFAAQGRELVLMKIGAELMLHTHG